MTEGFFFQLATESYLELSESKLSLTTLFGKMFRDGRRKLLTFCYISRVPDRFTGPFINPFRILVTFVTNLILPSLHVIRLISNLILPSVYVTPCQVLPAIFFARKHCQEYQRYPVYNNVHQKHIGACICSPTESHVHTLLRQFDDRRTDTQANMLYSKHPVDMNDLS